MSLVLNVEILGEFKKLTNATQGAQGSLKTLEGKVSGVANGIKKAVGALGLALGFNAIVNGFKDAVAAAETAKSANDRIDAIAKSMNEFGDQSKKTTDRIKKFAEEQELLVAVDATVIKATQAKLLTFRNLTKTADVMGGSFDRATMAAIDMAAAGFGEAESNATQLGKALNDPIAGITALNRAGIQFTTDQKALIASLVESGDVLSAQEIILKEIENQVGGTAAATADSSDKMKIAFNTVSETLGAALLPALDSLTEWFISVLPDIQNFLNGLLGALSSPEVDKSIKSMQDALGNLGFTIGTLFGSTETDQAKGFMNFWIILTGIIEGLATALNALIAPLSSVFGNTKPMENWLDTMLNGLMGIIGGVFGLQAPMPVVPSTTSGTRPNTNIVNNIQVKTDATAQEIANAINRANKATGTNLIRAR
jgi:hypothetical protein